MIEALVLSSRFFLFAIFLLAGLGKLGDLEGGKKSLKEMGFSESQASALNLILPFIEIAVAICFLPATTAWFASLAALVLLLGFSGFTLYQIRKGSSADCHCFGALHSEPISPKVVYRNLILAVPAVFLALQKERIESLHFSTLSFELSLGIIFGLATLTLLTLVCLYLKETIKKQNELLRRVELLSLISSEEAAQETDISAPTDGLLIGAPVPSFQATNGKGLTIDSTDIFQKPSVLFFMSDSCEPCKALLPEIQSWQEEMKEKLDFFFVLNEISSEHVQTFGNGNVILQKNQEISEIFNAKWTPTAIFVNRNGRIGSLPAAGDKAIRSLIEKIKSNGEVEFIPEGKPERDGKIGSQVPEFTLNDQNGNSFHSRQFIGRKTLLVYWSPTCGFCKEMLDELKEWEKERKPYDPFLVLISTSSDAETNRELGLQSPILTDEKGKVVETLGMRGTPSAILIDENAKIISQIAVGAKQIWALLGKLK